MSGEWVDVRFCIGRDDELGFEDVQLLCWLGFAYWMWGEPAMNFKARLVNGTPMISGWVYT